jgi:nucleotide-binding universal stress UspA family protein
MSATPLPSSQPIPLPLTGGGIFLRAASANEPIVVAADPSGGSSFTLRYAQQLAHRRHGELILVHIVDPLLFELGAQTTSSQEQTADKEERASLGANALAHVRSQADEDVLLSAVLGTARRKHAQLVVIGTRGHSSGARAALGKVARQLLMDSPCPVLVIGHEVEAALQQAGSWRRVLAATDFSAATVTALRLAHSLAGEELIALHCAVCGNTSVCPNCLERLRMLAPFNEAHTVPVRHIVECGEPADAIIEYAHTLHVDLVVLGPPALAQSDPRKPASSTVCQVVEEVDCPVLLVPQSAASAPPQSGYTVVLT